MCHMRHRLAISELPSPLYLSTSPPTAHRPPPSAHRPPLTAHRPPPTAHRVQDTLSTLMANEPDDLSQLLSLDEDSVR